VLTRGVFGRQQQLNFIEGYLGDYPNNYEVPLPRPSRICCCCSQLPSCSPGLNLLMGDRASPRATWAWVATSRTTRTSSRCEIPSCTETCPRDNSTHPPKQQLCSAASSGLGSTLETTQGQILSQSPTYATRFWWHLYGS